MDSLRQATPGDREAIAELYELVYRRQVGDNLAELIATYPSVVAYADEELVGFCLCREFGPDVAKLSTIAVREAWRSRGVGATMLGALENWLVEAGWAGLVLVNSMGYPGKEGGRFAGNFYRRAGYTLAIDTGVSLVFTKQLARS